MRTLHTFLILATFSLSSIGQNKLPKVNGETTLNGYIQTELSVSILSAMDSFVILNPKFTVISFQLVIAPAVFDPFVARINGNNCTKHSDRIKALKEGDVIIFDAIIAKNEDGDIVKLSPIYYKLTK